MLAALATTPSNLSTLKSVDYMEFVLRWWEGKKVPGGLAKILELHSDILPSTSRDCLEAHVPMTLGELLEFLQQNVGRTETEISLPFSRSPLPYVRLADVKIELSIELANAFLRQRQSQDAFLEQRQR